jgi:hypothetical protein
MKKGRGRRVLGGAEVRIASASASQGVDFDASLFEHASARPPSIHRTSQVAREFVMDAGSDIVIHANPLLSTSISKGVLGGSRAHIVNPRAKSATSGALKRLERDASGNSVIISTVSPESTIADDERGPFAPLSLSISCPGCGIGSCSVCNSSDALRFKAAVKVLVESLGKQRPKTALARCKILNDILRDGTALPRNALSGAVSAVSQLLWVFPAEAGVVIATCQALQLLVDRIAFLELGDRLECVSIGGGGGRGSSCMPVGILSEASQIGDDAVFESRINPIRVPAFAGWLIGGEGGSRPLGDPQSNADALVLCNLLQHLRPAYLSDASVWQYASTGLTSCCAAISELTRRDRALADREASLRSFASTSIAEVLVATLRMCEESEVLRQNSAFHTSLFGDVSSAAACQVAPEAPSTALDHVRV